MDFQVVRGGSRPLLRGPQLDELRAACAESASRLSGAFGCEAATSADDWTAMGGVWRMSWTWLLRRPGGDAPKASVGFRVTFDGRHCRVEAWSPLATGSISEAGCLAPGRLSLMLDLIRDLTLEVTQAPGNQG